MLDGYLLLMTSCWQQQQQQQQQTSHSIELYEQFTELVKGGGDVGVSKRKTSNETCSSCCSGYSDYTIETTVLPTVTEVPSQ